MPGQPTQKTKQSILEHLIYAVCSCQAAPVPPALQALPVVAVWGFSYFWFCFFTVFLGVIEAHGGRCFRTRCPNCRVELSKVPAARLFYGVLICFTCPAITVATIILRALDRVRERVLGSAPTAIFYRFTPGGLSVTFGSRILCDLDPALVMLLHCTVPGVDMWYRAGILVLFPVRNF